MSSSAIVKMIASSKRLHGWFLINCRSADYYEKINYLFLIYVDDKNIFHHLKFTQSNKLDFYCTEDDEFIWLPGEKKELTIPFNLHLDGIPNNDYFSQFLKKLKDQGHILNLMSIDQIKNYAAKPHIGIWNAFIAFVSKISRTWGIPPETAAYLVNRNQEFWPITEEYFYQKFNIKNTQRLYMLVKIESNFQKVFDKNTKKRAWLNRTHVNFNGKSPLELMMSDPAGILIVCENSSWIGS